MTSCFTCYCEIIPNDIFIEICNYLNLKNLMMIRQCNKSLYSSNDLITYEDYKDFYNKLANINNTLVVNTYSTTSFYHMMGFTNQRYSGDVKILKSLLLEKGFFLVVLKNADDLRQLLIFTASLLKNLADIIKFKYFKYLK